MTAWLASVRLATTENLSADGFGRPLTPTTLDGVAVAVNDQILVKDQTNPIQNGTWIADATPGVNMVRRAGETFEPESTVRVSEGTRNGHTAWSLRAEAGFAVGTDPLPWVRQDVRNYSCDSIAELKTLTSALENASAAVSGYYERADGGGGDFTFLGVTQPTNIINVDIVTVAITAVGNSNPAYDLIPPPPPPAPPPDPAPLGIVTISTAPNPHGLRSDLAKDFVASVYIDGDVYHGNPADPTNVLNGAFLVTVIDDETFTINARIYNATLGGGGATIKYVVVTTDAPHLRNAGEQMAISGVAASGGAAPLNALWYRGGVLETLATLADPTNAARNKITIPVNTSGGAYTPGTSAVIGDDAKLVVATDAAGTVGGVWRRNRIDPLNPRYFGARLDRQTDDLPALDAMIASVPETGARVYFPAGMAWTSDSWEIAKQVRLTGEGGGVGGLIFGCGIEVAPGRSAIVLSQGYTSISHLDLTSRVLFNELTLGAVSGYGIGEFAYAPGGRIRKGDCYVDGVNDELFFRALEDGIFGGAAPAWSATIGEVIVDTVPWITEAFPLVRDPLALPVNYPVGSRIFAENDNRYYFEAFVAGAPADGVVDPISPCLRAFKEASGVVLHAVFTDFADDTAPGATLKWLPRPAAGLHIRAPQCAGDNLRVTSFSGAAVNVQGGPESELPGNNANQCRVQDLLVDHCGLGVYAGGTNCNGWTVDRVNTYKLDVMPNPDAPGAGGYAIHDHSLAGYASGVYFEASSGVMLLRTGNGFSTYVGCTSEGPTESFVRDNGMAFIFGGNHVPTTDSNVTYVADVCRNITEPTAAASIPTTLHTHLTTLSGVFQFQSDDDPGGGYCLRYGYGGPVLPGFWRMQTAQKDAFALSTAAAGLDPGPGWHIYGLGSLEGNLEAAPGSLAFNGTYVAATSQQLRESRRRPGDRFRDALRTYLITGDGFRAAPWTPNTLADVRDVGLAIPASTVEPTANGPRPDAGLDVYYCIAGGTTDAGPGDPNWAGGPPVADGPDVLWDVLGQTPKMIVTYGPGGGQHKEDITAAGPFDVLEENAVNEFILLDGAPGGGRAVNLPAPANDQEAYRRVIRNTTGQAVTIGVTSGGVATEVVGANMTAILGFDSAGAFRVTADV